jgi:ATP-dependent DNA helicase 2 subunit 1
LELDRLVLCRWTARRGSPPRLVALLPQAEKLDEIGTQIKASGFNMIILPFADDIRHLRFDADDNDNEKVREATVASHEQIDKAKALITKLVLPGGAFNPDSYDNPVLQSHYANLQALALDQEIDGQLEDCTLPAYDRIKLRAQQEISDFAQVIGLNEVASLIEDLPKAKKSKQSDDFDPITAIAAVRSDSKALAKFTVNDLKSYLDSVGIKAKRVKAEIIEQITNQ